MRIDNDIMYLLGFFRELIYSLFELIFSRKYFDKNYRCFHSIIISHTETESLN